MEITLDILLYFLRSLHPHLICQKRKDVFFIGAYQFYASKTDDGYDQIQTDEDCQNQYLYITSLSELYQFRQIIAPEMMILVSEDCKLTEEQLKEIPCGLVLVDGKYEVPYLLNRMINVFSFLANWDKNMHIAALEGKSVQELLDLSEQMLQQPMILYDSGFDVLAYTKNISTPYEKFQETIAKGYTDASIMERIREEHILSRLGCGEILVAPAVGDTSLTNVYLAFRGNRNILGYACVFLDSDKAEAGYLDLLRIFAQNLTFCLKRDFENQRFGQMMYETFLLNLMNPSGTSAEQVTEQVKYIDGLTEYGRYVLGVVSFDEPDSVLLAFVARQFAQEMWDMKPFIYENQICMLHVLREKTDSFSGKEEYDADRVTKMLNSYHYTFGISNEFSHITDLRYAYRQAAAAIRCGRLKGQKLCRYSEYYFYDMLEVMEKQMPVEQLIAPIYRQMQVYDNKNKTRYLPMILKYLACNCNATHTAEEMYLHRNTIRKAVALVEERWQISLEDIQVKRDLLMSEMIEQYRVSVKNHPH